MADPPAVNLAISAFSGGAKGIPATPMTKVDSTHYTLDYMVENGKGTPTVTMSAGTDLAGNVVTATPTSGATFTVDNTAPTAAIAYSPSGPVKQGTPLT